VTATEPDVYYDPYDFEIDADPYPIWKRLRDERPLYYNERYGFYALSRFEDVQRCLVDWRTYISSRGTLLELIKADVDLGSGSLIFDDPPVHDLHRGLLSRVFTPRKMNAIEPKVREFCARSLDPLVGAGGFDFIRDLGAQMPMRTIGMLLGIPDPTRRRSATASTPACASTTVHRRPSAAPTASPRWTAAASRPTSTGESSTPPTTS
jgi:cytochrome P450